MTELDSRSPQDVLMAALEDVDGAKAVVILIDKESGFSIKSNELHPSDVHRILSMATYCNFTLMFGKEDSDG